MSCNLLQFYKRPLDWLCMFNQKTILALLIGVLVGGFLTHCLTTSHLHTNHHDNHPIANPYDTDYHVHADFQIVVRETLVNLDADIFQTTSQQELHPDAHLHDNNGDVKHIHAKDITFADFLDSLDITLTDSCLTLDNEYCSGEIEEVLLFVNDDLYTQPISTYVPVDNDRILLYYGKYSPETLQPFLDAVPDDACYYSGTCPERGIAPDENCGLTCEL